LPTPPKAEEITKAQIGAHLRSLRKARHLTQADLAKILGTHFANVSQVERGVRGLTLHQVVRLSKALRVSPDQILGQAKVSPKEGEPRSSRLLRRLERAQDLPAEDQRAVLRFLNSLLQSRGLPPAAPLRRGSAKSKKQPPSSSRKSVSRAARRASHGRASARREAGEAP
jgi:transcriptional regulator with XRE-family HTH domain